MKKLVSLACTLLVLCSLSACSGSEKLTFEDFALYQQGEKIVEHDGKDKNYHFIFSLMEDYYGTPGIYETKRGISIGAPVDLVFEQYKGIEGRYRDEESRETIAFFNKEDILEIFSSPLNGNITYLFLLAEDKTINNRLFSAEEQPEKVLYSLSFDILDEKVDDISICMVPPLPN